MSDQDYARILAKAIEVEDEHSNDPTWLGWSWQDVLAHSNTLNHMVVDGLIKINYESQKYRNFKIIDLAKATEFISAFQAGISNDPDPTTLIVPNDLFDFIVGHRQVKNICKLAIASDRPVHVLLIGPPATAKTLFLSELARLPGSRYALGGTSSRAGIVDFLIDNRPRYLIMDELDKMDTYDADVMLSLMETGIVTRLKRNMREEIRLDTWVFAGANNERRISSPLLSRFVLQRLPEYSESDFREVGRSIPVKRERIEPVLADKIIDAIGTKSRDPRDAVKVARLVTSGGDIQEIVDAMWPA